MPGLPRVSTGAVTGVVFPLVVLLQALLWHPKNEYNFRDLPHITVQKKANFSTQRKGLYELCDTC